MTPMVAFGNSEVELLLCGVQFSLSHDVASGNDITPCIKVDKPLVVYIWNDIHNNVAYTMTNISFSRKKNAISK